MFTFETPDVSYCDVEYEFLLSFAWKCTVHFPKGVAFPKQQVNEKSKGCFAEENPYRVKSIFGQVHVSDVKFVTTTACPYSHTSCKN